jgi:hypothetical protein
VAWVLAAALFIVASSPVDAQATRHLSGTLVRLIEDPFDPRVGFGLASDGTHLYVGGATDGVVRVVDPNTLATLRSIPTPAATVLGLAYANGALYAVDIDPTLDGVSPSRIYVIDAESGAVTAFFDAPDDGVASLSFGRDGLLYAVDGYEEGAIAPTRIYVFDPDDGNLVATLETGQLGRDVLEVFRNWVLFEDSLDPTGLSVYSVSGTTLVKEYAFETPGLSRRDWRGSTVVGRSLFLWGQRPGVTWLAEVRIVRNCGGKATICHVPPESPDASRTLCVATRGLAAHIGLHGGDYYGPCTAGASLPTDGPGGEGQ